MQLSKLLGGALGLPGPKRAVCAGDAHLPPTCILQCSHISLHAPDPVSPQASTFPPSQTPVLPAPPTSGLSPLCKHSGLCSSPAPHISPLSPLVLSNHDHCFYQSG